MNKIILEAETKLEDSEARQFILKLQEQIKTINERTKTHTLEIKELKKMIKQFTRKTN